MKTILNSGWKEVAKRAKSNYLTVMALLNNSPVNYRRGDAIENIKKAIAEMELETLDKVKWIMLSELDVQKDCYKLDGRAYTGLAVEIASTRQFHIYRLINGRIYNSKGLSADKE